MTVTDLKNLVVEVLHHDDKGWSAGSGFFVSKGLVLTALHIVDGPGEVFIRIQGKEEHPAVVRLQGNNDIVDLAVLEVPDVVVDVPLLRYGEVDRREARIVKECWAVGFPRFKLLKHEPSKPKPPPSSAHVWGEIPTGEFLGQQLLTLQVSKSPRPLRKGSEWGGMSGAVVFSGDDIVVGVVTEHRLPEGESALTVVPITALDLLSEVEATKWWKLLGVDRQALVPLPNMRPASLPLSTKSSPFMAPDLPAHFVPRDYQFEQLLSQLLDPKRQNLVAITTALRGAGGFGKTTLAAALCHDEAIQNTFNDGVLWVTLGEQPNILDALLKLYRALTTENPGFVDVEEGAIRLAEKLADKDYLLVIDDVWNIAHVRPFLRGGKRCARLITTRLLDVAVEVAATPITVDEMTATESVQLLVAGLYPLPKDLRPFYILAARFGEWPLLLELANSMLRTQLVRGSTLEGALNWIQQALDKRGIIAITRRDAEQRKASIAGTIAVSLELLNSDQRAHYTELAVFAEDIEIPHVVIAALWNQELFDVTDLLYQLDNLALLKFNPQHETIRLHDALRKYLITQVQDMAKLHAHLIDTWGNPYALPLTFAWRWYGYHLLSAGQQKQLERLLLDVQWLEAKLRQVGVWDLLRDYELIAAGEEGEASQASQQDQPGSQAALIAFEVALRREAHILSEHPDLLWQQLYNRLQWEGEPVQQVLALELERRNAPGTAPWMHLRTRVPMSSALLYTLFGHTRPVTACAVDPHGARVVTTSEDGTLKIWDLYTGQELRTLDSDGYGVTACAFSPDGATIVSGALGGQLELWDADTGRKLGQLWGHHHKITTCVFSPDGSQIFSADVDHKLYSWDRKSGAFGSVGVQWMNPHFQSINALAFRADGMRVASASDDGYVRIWSPHNGVWFVTIRADPTSRTTDCAFSPDGNLLASASEDSTIKLWQAETGDLLGTLRGHTDTVTACRFSPDGTRLVSASEDRTLMVWDTSSQQRIATLEGHGGQITNCCISLDGTRLVSTGGSFDRTVRIWDLREVVARNENELGREADRLQGYPPDRRRQIEEWRNESDQADLASEQHTFLASNFHSATGPMNAVVIMPASDGTWESSRVDVSEICASVLPPNVHWWHYCAVTPDGSYAVTWPPGGSIELWDVRQRAKRATLLNDFHEITAGVISGDGRYIVFGGVVSQPFEGRIIWLNIATGQQKVIYQSHAGRIPACGISPDGRYIISIGEDGLLKLWDMQSEGELCIFYIASDLYRLTVHPWRQSVLVTDYYILREDYHEHAFIVDIMGIEYGPLIVTPRDRGAGPMVRCPVCGHDLALDRSQLGTVLACTQLGCASHMRVNPFIIQTSGLDVPRRRRSLRSG